MQKFPLAALLFLFALLSNNSPAADLPRPGETTAGARVTENFDANWLFLQDPFGTEKNQFDDSAWRKLDLPHDWSIEGPFSKVNRAGGPGAFLPTGVAWYRKHFSLPEQMSGQNFFIEFDGVMQNGSVWINGFHLGQRPYGYVSFSYELTGHLNFGGDNVLAVRADTSAQPASRWYAGGGIYRHVRLVSTGPVHIVQNGVFVTTPQVSPEQVTVRVQTTITNQSAAPHTVTIQTTLIAPDGKSVATVESGCLITNGASADVKQEIVFPKPQLWNLDDPKLYQAVSKVMDGKKILDETAATFGLRDAKFTSDQGFLLNGKKVPIYGVGLHQDGGAFGAAVPLAIWEQRLTELKKLGVNAIRTAHNPFAPEFLDLCDRMGFLVMDEMFDVWAATKLQNDYHLYFNTWSKIDVADTVRRDRNHPSVILYCAGNEIRDTANAPLAKTILTGLIEAFHTNDPTRPVTQALFRPNVTHDYDNGFADLLDVIGTNYRDDELLAAQRAKPERKIIGTEQHRDRQAWLSLRDHPSYSGQFIWAGVDYLGESQRWPTVNHSSSMLNRTGEIRPRAFEQQSWWTAAPMVRLVRRTAPSDATPAELASGVEQLYTQVQFANWTPRNPAPHDETVEAYSNCEEVELFLNGQSLGAEKINTNAAPRAWKIPFAPGTLKAVAKNGGNVVATDELRTAGKAEKIILTTGTQTLSPGFDNVAVVRATIVDANGVTVPHADDLIAFKLSGPGALAAVDNADGVSHEPFQASERHAFQGKCAAFVKATATAGEIVLTATADGLAAGSITIRASPELSR